MYNLMQDAFKALDEIKDDEIFAPVFKQRGMAKPVNESKETKKAATKVVENAKRKEARKPIEESCNALKKELKEEPQYDLKPQYDSRKSFYGKAWVDDKGNGTKVLYSYRTPVVRIEDGKVTLLRKGYLGWSSSPTTLRHVKDFLKQNGFEAGSVNDIAKMYPTEQARVDESYRKCESLVNLYNKDEVRKAKQCLEDKAEGRTPRSLSMQMQRQWMSSRIPMSAAQSFVAQFARHWFTGSPRSLQRMRAKTYTT